MCCAGYMDGDRERRLVPLVLVGVVVVALFVGAGTLVGGYLGRHASSPSSEPPPSSVRPPSSPSPSSSEPPPSAVYEAENGANTVSGGAFIAKYPGASGGRIVKNLGVWGNPAGAGKLTFTAVRARAA